MEDAQRGLCTPIANCDFRGRRRPPTMKRNSVTSSVSKKAYTERFSAISSLGAPQYLLPRR
jgi:hypothetical protein